MDVREGSHSYAGMDRAYVNIYSSGVLCFTVPADGDALSLLSIEPQ